MNLSSTKIEHLTDSMCTMYNLQTLLLWGCDVLVELPINMVKLVNLRYLDVRNTQLKEMPLQMGKLRNLQNLRIFLVGKHSGSTIRDLGKLKNLFGTLCISNLEKVHCTRDAMESNLKDKKYLSEFELLWCKDHVTHNSENKKNVLTQLRPHTNLKSLFIEHYYGTNYQLG